MFENAKRIYREVKLLRLLDHANIVKVVHMPLPHDPLHYDDVYIVFEKMDSDLLKLGNKIDVQLTLGNVTSILYQLLKALKFVHSAGVIHRDIKPANVLVSDSYGVKVTQFR